MMREALAHVYSVELWYWFCETCETAGNDYKSEDFETRRKAEAQAKKHNREVHPKPY